jgi:hypothetical protein
MMLLELANILSFTSRTAPIEGEEARSDKGVVTPTSELSYDPDLLSELDDPSNERNHLLCICLLVELTNLCSSPQPLFAADF